LVEDKIFQDTIFCRHNLGAVFSVPKKSHNEPFSLTVSSIFFVLAAFVLLLPFLKTYH
jgi:hypothetical protein